MLCLSPVKFVSSRVFYLKLESIMLVNVFQTASRLVVHPWTRWRDTSATTPHLRLGNLASSRSNTKTNSTTNAHTTCFGRGSLGAPQKSILTEFSAKRSQRDGGMEWPQMTTGDIVVPIVLGFTTTLRKSNTDHAQKMAFVRKIKNHRCKCDYIYQG